MRYRTRPIRPPLQTRLHAVCRGKIPAAPKKAPSRKGNSAPDVGLSSPTPCRHSVFSPALRFWDTRHDSPPACGLSNTCPKSRVRRVYRAELAASREIPRGPKNKEAGGRLYFSSRPTPCRQPSASWLSPLATRIFARGRQAPFYRLAGPATWDACSIDRKHEDYRDACPKSEGPAR